MPQTLIYYIYMINVSVLIVCGFQQFLGRKGGFQASFGVFLVGLDVLLGRIVDKHHA